MKLKYINLNFSNWLFNNLNWFLVYLPNLINLNLHDWYKMTIDTFLLSKN